MPKEFNLFGGEPGGRDALSRQLATTTSAAVSVAGQVGEATRSLAAAAERAGARAVESMRYAMAQAEARRSQQNRQAGINDLVGWANSKEGRSELYGQPYENTRAGLYGLSGMSESEMRNAWAQTRGDPAIRNDDDYWKAQKKLLDEKIAVPILNTGALQRRLGAIADQYGPEAAAAAAQYMSQSKMLGSGYTMDPSAGVGDPRGAAILEIETDLLARDNKLFGTISPSVSREQQLSFGQDSNAAVLEAIDEGMGRLLEHGELRVPLTESLLGQVGIDVPESTPLRGILGGAGVDLRLGPDMGLSVLIQGEEQGRATEQLRGLPQSQLGPLRAALLAGGGLAQSTLRGAGRMAEREGIMGPPPPLPTAPEPPPIAAPSRALRPEDRRLIDAARAGGAKPSVGPAAPPSRPARPVERGPTRKRRGEGGS